MFGVYWSTDSKWPSKYSEFPSQSISFSAAWSLVPVFLLSSETGSSWAPSSCLKANVSLRRWPFSLPRGLAVWHMALGFVSRSHKFYFCLFLLFCSVILSKLSHPFILLSWQMGSKADGHSFPSSVASGKKKTMSQGTLGFPGILPYLSLALTKLLKSQ